MKFRAEFRRRLQRLYDAIGRALLKDCNDEAQLHGNLFPYLYSVMTYLWSFDKDKNILIK